MSTVGEKNANPIQEMTRVLVSPLDLASRGFRESFRSAKPAALIYDSEWCRVKLVWEGWDYFVGNSISIYYGRLHAPNEEATMIWNGEECHCWHSFEHSLYFLDGRAPAEVATLNLSHPITDPFYESAFRQKFSRHQPKWVALMHAAAFQHYGKRFFELFDLRRPDLWDQYRQFLKELYDIEGRIPEIKPPLDKVC